MTIKFKSDHSKTLADSAYALMQKGVVEVNNISVNQYFTSVTFYIYPEAKDAASTAK